MKNVTVKRLCKELIKESNYAILAEDEQTTLFNTASNILHEINLPGYDGYYTAANVKDGLEIINALIRCGYDAYLDMISEYSVRVRIR